MLSEVKHLAATKFTGLRTARFFGRHGDLRMTAPLS